MQRSPLEHASGRASPPLHARDHRVELSRELRRFRERGELRDVAVSARASASTAPSGSLSPRAFLFFTTLDARPAATHLLDGPLARRIARRRPLPHRSERGDGGERLGDGLLRTRAFLFRELALARRRGGVPLTHAEDRASPENDASTRRLRTTTHASPKRTAERRLDEARSRLHMREGAKLSTLKISKWTKNKESKLRRIEAAAEALFAERGYDDTTTRAIARKARIAAGTLFTYFPEKRALLLHLFRRKIDDAIERGFARAPRDATASETLTHVFLTIYRAYEGDRALARVFVKDALFAEGDVGVEMAAWTATFIARVAALLDQMQARGALDRRVDAPMAAYQIFAAYYLGLVSWLGSSAVTAAHRDHALRASIAQLLDRRTT